MCAELKAKGWKPRKPGRTVPFVDPLVPNPGKQPLVLQYDGSHAPLSIDADFLEGALAWRKAHPDALPARGEIRQIGDVFILQADDATVYEMDGALGIKSHAAIAQRVIEAGGDNFDFITIWMNFPDDRSGPMAGAYENTVRQDVTGIGQARYDNSAAYGSNGVLRSMLNMKEMVYGSKGVHPNILEVWGQESAHRWLVFMDFIDPRTGKPANGTGLLGRQCAHYSAFVDSQASIEDGVSWRDNKDGTFTALEQTERYGNLDLYAMGLLAPDEFPPMFIIQDVPGWSNPRCGTTYDTAIKAFGGGNTVMGTRVDLPIESFVEANGTRLPTSDQVNGYYREAEVILIRPTDTVDSKVVLGTWMNVARKQWEDWNPGASGRRQVICTQINEDCGDPRSDVVRLEATNNVEGAVVPAVGNVGVQVEVKNTGGRTTTGIEARLEVRRGDELVFEGKQPVADLAVGGSQVVTFDVDMKGAPCGTEIHMKAVTQSDFHYNRRFATLFPGITVKASDGFESDTGWKVDPDGDDTSGGAVWERGTPARTVLLRTQLQPQGAHGGVKAWVTGAAATGDGPYVVGGKTTLQSPEYEGAGLRDPMLRYFVSFSAVKSPDSKELVTSPEGSLTVLGRTGGGTWMEVDKLSNTLTNGWVQRNIRLPAALIDGGKLQFRFVADDTTASRGAVEAAIDDIEVSSNIAQCYGEQPDAGTGEQDGGQDGGVGATPGDGGCGCTVPGPALPFAGVGGLALTVAALARRRRQR